MAFRQAIARTWQIPLFILSMVVFVGMLLAIRPRPREISFEERMEHLAMLVREGRFHDFYVEAEALRQQTENDEELGQVHYLAARARVRELSQRHELGVGGLFRRGAAINYERIIEDYKQALHRGCPPMESPTAVEVFADLGLAYWGLGQVENALTSFDKATELGPRFRPDLHRTMVRMLLASRPADYLARAEEHLQRLQQEPDAGPDDRAWAFVRQAELLIMKGQVEQALAQLAAPGQDMNLADYQEEMQFLRCLALRHSGQADQADIELRRLLSVMSDRGDVYARVVLELGRINFEQYRYHDARYFYELLVQSQTGKDWYAAGKLGLAECAALHEQYEEAAGLYQEAVTLLKLNPLNPVVDLATVQQSLAMLAHDLGMVKAFGLALPFLEIEQQIAAADDIDAAHRFARMHDARARQLQEELEAALAAVVDSEPAPGEAAWEEQQRRKVAAHYEAAAEQYLRVAKMTAAGDDTLYGEALQMAAAAYDKAGNVDKSIETWLRFVEEREGNAYWPTALFRLAQAYQSVGEFHKAIGYYETLLREHPRSTARFQGMVPLARCYLGLEPPQREQAENLLRAVLTDRALTPTSSYFRDALFELGTLYYDDKRYADAIEVLNEAIERYPTDPLLGKALFFVADSYRASGLTIHETLAEMDVQQSTSHEKMVGRWRDNLENAQRYFERAIAFYATQPAGRLEPLDELYLRHSWLYRADCLFDLGQYVEASRAYEEAALRYQLTPTALVALVQVTNCQVALGNVGEARSTNERAQWQLRKMTDDALLSGPLGRSRAEWQNWFQWVGQAGLWQ